MDLVIASQNKKYSTIKKKLNYHHGDLKSQILLAVGKLIEKHHSTEFQLREIASLVNTSVPAIYRHFENKQQILVEAAINGYEVQKSFRNLGLNTSNKTALHKLVVIGFAYVAFARAYPGLFMLMKNLETNEILAAQEYARQREETLEVVKKTFQDCIDEGLVENIDSEIALTFLQATSLGFAQMLIGKSMVFFATVHGHDETLISKVYQTAIQGILTTKGKSVLESAIINPFLQWQGKGVSV